MNEKPTFMIWIEFFCFVLVGALAATGDKLSGGVSWHDLATPGIIVAMLIGGGNAALSFLNPSGTQIKPKVKSK